MASLRRRACLLVAVLLCSAIAWGQAFDPSDEGWEGMSGFLEVARSTLGNERVRVLSRLDWSQLAEGDALLLVHPKRTLDFEQVSSFLDRGGRMALLDDHGRGAELLDHFRIKRRPAPTDPEVYLRENAELAIATPVDEEPTAGTQPPNQGGRHPIVADVEQVVTNHPTVLAPARSVELTPLLQIPTRDGERALIALVGVIGDPKSCAPDSAASAASDQCGRLVAISDPSAFINLMLRYPGNRALAQGLVRYLANADGSSRQAGKLYVLWGDFAQVGQLEQATLLERLRELLTELRDALQRLREEGLPEGGVRLLAALGVALLASMLLKATSLPGLRAPRFTQPAPLVAQGGPVGRAAVLSASTTHPALAILELKAALEETLRQRLALESTASTTAILQATGESGLLRPASSAKLRGMLSEMGRAEAALHGRRRMRVRAHDLRRLREQTLSLVSEIELGEGRRG